ncbi:MAG: DUF885 domain-containing protein, partial [Psychrosphaera sp.]|nr:DUF885 domain-containing protein [Psychrosphaera sp.]
MYQKTLIAALVCSVLAGCGTSANKSLSLEAQMSPKQAMKAVSRADIDLLVDRHTREFLTLQPALATALNVDASVAGNFSVKLPDYSAAGMKNVQQTMAKAAADLAKIDLDSLSEQDRLHVAVNKAIDEYYAGDLDFSGGYIDTWGGHLPYIVSQIAGPLIDIPTVFQDQHVVSNRQQADDYLVRLAGFGVLIDQVLSKVKSDEKAGIILPKKLFANTLGYLKGFSDVPASKHSLVATFEAKLSKIHSMDGKMRQQYSQKAIAIVYGQILPGYRKVHAFMSEQQHRAPNDDGIWAQPGGESFYVHEILNLGDSVLSPDEIHQIGLDEVARITIEMDGILKANGKIQGSVGERMMALNDDPQFIYEDSDQGREQLLADLRKEVDIIMKKAPMLFATLPKQEVVVKRVPIVREKGAPGGSYVPPALDGSRAGEYFINLYDMKSNPSFGLKTLTYHEAVPGHHFQIAL